MESSSNPNQQRKLAAILFGDIQGYTALMQKGETQAMSILDRYQEVTRVMVNEHRGEIIKTYGDGSLILFDSTVDAVKCAYDMQMDFRLEPKVPLRIGIHIGEIVRKGNDVFGNGVNIASRVESMGIPGSILISEDAYKKIKNQEQFTTTSLGKYSFKNVDESIEVFAVTNEGLSIPQKGRVQGKFKTKKPANVRWIGLALLFLAILSVAYYFNKDTFAGSETIRDQSIAVLPFENLSNNSEEQYFSDGISQDILTNLAGIKDLQVISFNSSKIYRSSAQPIPAIGSALGVSNILNGSVHRQGDKLVLRTSLVDVSTGEMIWGERFDLTLDDIFSVQADVSHKIAGVLKAELLPSASQRINKKPTDNMKAYQEYSQGRYLMGLRGNENLDNAGIHFQSAIKEDPDFALAYAAYASVLSLKASNPENDRSTQFTKSKELAEKAISIDPNLADAYAVIGVYYNRYTSELNEAISYLKKAVDLAPGNATNHQWLAEAALNKGDVNLARSEIEIAKKLDPGQKIMELIDAIVMISEDRYREAQKKLEMLYAENPGLGPISFFMFYSYLHSGDIEKAKLVQMPPGYDNRDLYSYLDDQKSLEKLAEDLKVGEKKYDTDRLTYQVESEVLRISGNIERYVERLDSSIFILYMSDLGYLQHFPPDDKVRLHPRFQQMMKDRGFTLRPRTPF